MQSLKGWGPWTWPFGNVVSLTRLSRDQIKWLLNTCNGGGRGESGRIEIKWGRGKEGGKLRSVFCLGRDSVWRISRSLAQSANILSLQSAMGADFQLLPATQQRDLFLKMPPRMLQCAQIRNTVIFSDFHPFLVWGDFLCLIKAMREWSAPLISWPWRGQLPGT